MLLSSPSAAILRAAHHHRWRDHRHGPDTHCYCRSLLPAHVHHHSGSGQGRLQRDGVPRQWWQAAAFGPRRCRRERHRPVCALQRFPGKLKPLPLCCSNRVNSIYATDILPTVLYINLIWPCPASHSLLFNFHWHIHSIMCLNGAKNSSHSCNIVIAGKQRGPCPERPGRAARSSGFLLQYLQAETT